MTVLDCDFIQVIGLQAHERFKVLFYPNSVLWIGWLELIFAGARPCRQFFSCIEHIDKSIVFYFRKLCRLIRIHLGQAKGNVESRRGHVFYLIPSVVVLLCQLIQLDTGDLSVGEHCC